MTLVEKAKEMRNAIDAIELALSGLEGFDKTVRLWEGAPNDFYVKVDMTLGDVRQLNDAYGELNRIVNSSEYVPANLGE